MKSFVYNGLPSRVIFGYGTISRAAEEMSHLNCSRALVISTPDQANAAVALAKTLGNKAAGVFSEATMHTPIEITAAAVAQVSALGADSTVALGGGSTIGLGKAIALRTDLPQIAIPTTYAGSEMTPIIGETAAGRKTTQRTLKVLPEVVIYDVELTMTLPPGLSATSGMNAMAHAVEAIYAQDSNPITSLMASECIRALGGSLPGIVQDPGNRQARYDALYGAWLGGVCLGSVGMALHHKLCHVLGGMFNLPHAATHTVMLPHVVAYNASAAREVAFRIAESLGVEDAARGLFDLAEKLGAPRTLRELGMKEDDIEVAADLAVQNPYWNPRPIRRNEIHALIARAWRGEPPSDGFQR